MPLPTLSRVKLNLLLRQSQEAYDALAAVTRHASELNRSLSTAPASDADVIREEIKRQHERQSDLAAKHRNLTDLCSAVEHWLASNQQPLEYLKPAKAAPEKGETITAAIIRVRGDIATLYRERSKALRAGVPKSDLRESAQRYVQSLRDKGAPRIIGTDHAQDFGVQFVFSESWEDKGIRANLPAILCWLDPAAFEKRLVEAIDNRPEPAFAMSSAARAEKIIELEAAILKAEREEEGLIDAAEGDGVLVIRRLEASPLAILSLRKVEPAKSKPERVRASAS